MALYKSELKKEMIPLQALQWSEVESSLSIDKLELEKFDRDSDTPSTIKQIVEDFVQSNVFSESFLLSQKNGKGIVPRVSFESLLEYPKSFPYPRSTWSLTNKASWNNSPSFHCFLPIHGYSMTERGYFACGVFKASSMTLNRNGNRLESVRGVQGSPSTEIRNICSGYIYHTFPETIEKWTLGKVIQPFFRLKIDFGFPNNSREALFDHSFIAYEPFGVSSFKKRQFSWKELVEIAPCNEVP